MLTAADLGPDFASTGTQGGVIGAGGFNGCDTLNHDPAGTAESASAGFADSASATGLAVTEALFVLSPADMANAMKAYTQLPTDCASFTATLGGLPFAFTAAPLTVTAHGEETTATRLTGTTTYSNEVITLYLDMVFMQYRGTIINVIVVNGNTPDIDETQSAAANAYTIYTQAAAKW